MLSIKVQLSKLEITKRLRSNTFVIANTTCLIINKNQTPEDNSYIVFDFIRQFRDGGTKYKGE